MPLAPGARSRPGLRVAQGRASSRPATRQPGPGTTPRRRRCTPTLLPGGGNSAPGRRANHRHAGRGHMPGTGSSRHLLFLSSVLPRSPGLIHRLPRCLDRRQDACGRPRRVCRAEVVGASHPNLWPTDQTEVTSRSGALSGRGRERGVRLECGGDCATLVRASASRRTTGSSEGCGRRARSSKGSGPITRS